MNQYNTYFIPHQNGEEAQTMLNVFLRSHRVLKVDKVYSPEGWAFCVEWMDGVPSAGPVDPAAYRRAEKVDYMKVLPKETFARFSALRVRRKELAFEKGVKAYEVMTDAQLAEIAKLEQPTLAALGKIPGVGESRVKNYGKALIEVLETVGEGVVENDHVEAQSRRDGNGESEENLEAALKIEEKQEETPF